MFYLSKRAKNYVEKREEESGNITYIYDEKWVKRRWKKKEKKIKQLEENVSDLLKKIKEDLKSDDDEIKQIAIAVSLIYDTKERIGNEFSADERKHYGVTTWLVKHITFSGGKAKIKYVGKSGVDQEKIVNNKETVSALKELIKDKKKGDKVFTITPKMVNKYLKKFKITAKDIRGAEANSLLKKELKKQRKGTLPKEEKEKEKKLKEELNNALENVSKDLGHQPSTLKNQYILPNTIETYLSSGKVASLKEELLLWGNEEDEHKLSFWKNRYNEEELLKIAKEKHTGAMIAIMVPKKLNKFIGEGVSSDGLHITLIYLGKAKDIDNITRKAIIKSVEKVCSHHKPLSMYIAGTGMFSKGDDGVPIFFIPNSVGLNALQNDLQDAISNIIDLPSEHGWVPHITIGYIDDYNVELPSLEKLPKWKAKNVVFFAGGDKIAEIDLGKKQANFKLSKRANEDHDEVFEGFNDEEMKGFEEYWDNLAKQIEKEKKNKPKRKRSEMTLYEIDIMEEMDPEERAEWINKYFIKDAQDLEVKTPGAQILIEPYDTAVAKALAKLPPHIKNNIIKIIVHPEGGPGQLGHVEMGPGKDPREVHIFKNRINEQVKRMFGSTQPNAQQLEQATEKALVETLIHEGVHIGPEKNPEQIINPSHRFKGESETEAETKRHMTGLFPNMAIDASLKLDEIRNKYFPAESMTEPDLEFTTYCALNKKYDIVKKGIDLFMDPVIHPVILEIKDAIKFNKKAINDTKAIKLIGMLNSKCISEDEVLNLACLQVINGLKPTGKLDRKTLSKLGKFDKLPRNFGIVVPKKLYRGGMIDNLEQLQTLKDMGVERVISLHNNPEIGRMCGEIGMDHIPAPIETGSSEDYGRKILGDRISELLLEKPTYIHCWFGADRTGGVIARFRTEGGWSNKDAYLEAKAYGFKDFFVNLIEWFSEMGKDPTPVDTKQIRKIIEEIENCPYKNPEIIEQDAFVPTPTDQPLRGFQDIFPRYETWLDTARNVNPIMSMTPPFGGVG